MARITINPNDSQEVKEAKLAKVESWDKITQVKIHLESDHFDRPAKTPQELLDDPQQHPYLRAAAALFLEAKSNKAGHTYIRFGNCGSFDGGDVILIYRAKDYKQPGFRAWLYRTLLKLHILEIDHA